MNNFDLERTKKATQSYQTSQTRSQPQRIQVSDHLAMGLATSDANSLKRKRMETQSQTAVSPMLKIFIERINQQLQQLENNFEQFSPQIQHKILYGLENINKSLIELSQPHVLSEKAKELTTQQSKKCRTEGESESAITQDLENEEKAQSLVPQITWKLFTRKKLPGEIQQIALGKNSTFVSYTRDDNKTCRAVFHEEIHILEAKSPRGMHPNNLYFLDPIIFVSYKESSLIEGYLIESNSEKIAFTYYDPLLKNNITKICVFNDQLLLGLDSGFIWQISTTQTYPKPTIYPGRDKVTALASNDQYLISGSNQGDIRVYDKPRKLEAVFKISDRSQISEIFLNESIVCTISENRLLILTIEKLDYDLDFNIIYETQFDSNLIQIRLINNLILAATQNVIQCATLYPHPIVWQKIWSCEDDIITSMAATHSQLTIGTQKGEIYFFNRG